jgi:hypothetical protein
MSNNPHQDDFVKFVKSYEVSELSGAEFAPVRAKLIAHPYAASVTEATPINTQLLIQEMTAGEENEIALLKLTLAATILETEQRRASEADKADQEEEEEEEEEEETDEEEEEEDGNFNKIVDHFMERHTYKTEAFAIYFKILSKSRQIERVHTGVVVGRTKANDSWEYTKEKIKALLSFFGLEGVFIALDALSERSLIVRHLLKILGTLAIPIIFLVGAFIAISKITANPLQKLTKWLTSELDIQLPGEENE